MKTKRNKLDGRVIPFLLLWLVAMVASLTLSGCKSKQIVSDTKQHDTKLERIENAKYELLTDSTKHTYTIERVKIYAPDSGMLIREEERRSGEVQNEIVEERTNASRMANEDTTLSEQHSEDKATGSSAPTPVSTTVNHLSRTIISIVALVLAIFVCIRMANRYVKYMY